LPWKVKEQVETEVKKRGMKSCIVVFHERLSTFQALPEIVAFFKKANYKFVRLDEYFILKGKEKNQ
jgi:hypothetical protein